jgi:hypothetical protein
MAFFSKSMREEKRLNKKIQTTIAPKVLSPAMKLSI